MLYFMLVRSVVRSVEEEEEVENGLGERKLCSGTHSL
jgi:hypothetical protein